MGFSFLILFFFTKKKKEIRFDYMEFVKRAK